MAEPTNPTPPGSGSSTSVDPRVVQNVNNALQEQARILAQLNAAIAQMAESLTQMDQEDRNGVLDPSRWDDLRQHIDDTNDAASGGQGVLGKLTGAFGKVSGMIMGPIGGAFSFLGKGLGVATDALSGLVAMGGNFLSFLGDAAAGIFNVSMAIISIPFKIMAKLFEMAASTPGDNSYAKALQAIVKSYGALESVGPRAIKSVSKNMDKFSSDGRSALMVWGNLAQRTEAVLKFAEELGPQFERNIDAFNQNGEMFMRFQRGLALSGEAMQAVFQRAEAAGQKPEKVLTNIHKIAKGLGKEFGIDAKIISRDMGKAMQDLAHFGHLSDIELGIAATLANKLGVSVDKLTGIMDQTLTFDQAAEAASKLNEQFHTNIQAMDLLNAKGPGDVLDVYRKGFAEAGVDLAKLDWRARSFVKSTTNMSDELFQASASSKNMSVTTAGIRKEAEKAEKAIVSETQALKELNPQIDMMIPDAGQMPKSIFEGIMEGIDRSFKRMPEFRGLMMNLRAILKDSIAFGTKIGDLLKELPGVRDIIGGLQEMFNPSNWHRMFDRLLGAFRSFATDGYQNFDKLVQDIWGALSGLFGDSAPGANRLWKGVTSFFNFFEDLVRRGIGWIIEKIADGISFMADWLPDKVRALLDWIKDPTAKLNLGIKTPGVVSKWAKIFDPLIPAMEKFKKTAWPAIKEFFSYLGDQIGEWLKEKLGSIFKSPAFWITLLGSIALPMLGQMIMMKRLGKQIGDQVGAGVKDGVTQALREACQQNQGCPPGLGPRPGPPGPPRPGPPQPPAPKPSLGSRINKGAGTMGNAALAMMAMEAGTYAITTAWSAGAAYKQSEGAAKKMYMEYEEASKLAQDKTRSARERYESVLAKSKEFYGKAEEASKAVDAGAVKMLGSLFSWLPGGTAALQNYKTEAEENALAEADALKRQAEELRKSLEDKDSPEYKKRLEEEAKVKADERRKHYEDLVKSNMGLDDGQPLDIEKLRGLMKSYDDFLTELKNSDIQGKIDAVEEQLKSIDWELMKQDKEDELIKSAGQLHVIVDAFNSIRDMGNAVAEAKNGIANMINALGSGAASFFNALGADGYIRKITDKLSETFIQTSNFTDINEEITNQKEVLTNLGNFGTTLSTTITSVLSGVRDLTNFQNDPAVAAIMETKEIPGFKEGMMSIHAAISTMVEKTKEIDKTLATMPPFNMAARLKPIAEGMGFGGKYAYEVRGGTVKVELNLQVHMDAADLETQLIMRKTSFVRDRINFALANSTDTENGNKGLLKTNEDPNTQKLSSVP